MHGRPDPEWGEAVRRHRGPAPRRGGRLPRSCATTARSASPASRCPRRSASRARSRAPRRASCCGASWPPGRVPEVDAETYRADSHERWTRSAQGWGARRAELQRIAQRVSLLDARARRRSSRASACSSWRPGPATPACWPPSSSRPGGGVIITDFAEPMVDVARAPRDRARCAQRGVPRHRRRVDRPAGGRGGRRALPLGLHAHGRPRPPRCARRGACCGPAAVSRSRPGTPGRSTAGPRSSAGRWSRAGSTAPPDPDAPGMFAFSPEGRIEGLLEAAGFSDIAVESVDLGVPLRRLRALLGAMIDLNRPLGDAVATMDDATSSRSFGQRCATPSRTRRRQTARSTIPARTLVASATA